MEMAVESAVVSADQDVNNVGYSVSSLSER
jgi:hypothetical protein